MQLPELVVSVLAPNKFGSFTCLADCKIPFVLARNDIREYQKVAILKLLWSIKIFVLLPYKTIQENIKANL